MHLRKMLLNVCLVVLLGVVLAACGGTSANDKSAASNNSGQAQENGAAAESNNAGNNAATESKTKLYKDGLDREVEIPVNPQRIVALNNFGELAALGVKPIGLLEYDLNIYDAKLVEGIENVGGQEPNMEKIISLEPDLIIVANYLKPEVIESLQKIAPTVATKWGLTSFEQLHAVAEMLGKGTEEQAWLTKYNAQVEEARKQLKPFMKDGETATVLQFFGKNIYTYRMDTFSAIYDGLGFAATEKVKAVKDPVQLSEEVLPEFVGDRLFILVADKDAETNFNDLKSHSIWNNLPAVKNNKVYLVDNFRYSNFNATNMEWQLNDLVDKLGK